MLCLDPSVLGLPLFSNVHPGKHLYPRNNGSMNGLRYLVDVMQDAVDAEADEAHVSLRFDMDVRGPARIGVMEKVLHGIDDMLVSGLKLTDGFQLYESVRGSRGLSQRRFPYSRK